MANVWCKKIKFLKDQLFYSAELYMTLCKFRDQVPNPALDLLARDFIFTFTINSIKSLFESLRFELNSFN